MSVPRGTNSEPVRVVLTAWQKEAIAEGVLHELRVPITAENSIVQPGEFAGLDLETGRAQDDRGELRARCRFESGERAVSVRPIYAPDMELAPAKWVRHRPLLVEEVTARRLQDMTHADASLSGWLYIPKRCLQNASRVLSFANAWDKYKAPGALPWASNQWVWVLGVRAI